MSIRVVIHLLAAQPRKGQEIVDELAHLVGVVLDQPEITLAFGIQPRRVVLHHRLGEPADRPQRRPQVVRNRVGERLKLLVDGLQERFRLLDFGSLDLDVLQHVHQGPLGVGQLVPFLVHVFQQIQGRLLNQLGVPALFVEILQDVQRRPLSLFERLKSLAQMSRSRQVDCALGQRAVTLFTATSS